MAERKVIMLTDSSLTYEKVMAPDAQAVLKGWRHMEPKSYMCRNKKAGIVLCL